MKKLISTLLLFLIASFNLPAFAASNQKTAFPASNDSYMFYDIANGQRKRAPAGGLKYKMPLNLQAKFGLDYSCGKFDPKFAVKQTLNKLKERIVSVGDGLQASASGLPGYVICRANPLICQLMEGYTHKAEKLVQVAMANCEELEKAGKKGRSLLDSWIQVSVKENMDVMSSGGENDITEAIKKAKKDGGKKGITWIGGRKAG